MFTKNYYAGNFYSRQKAKRKYRGVKFSKRRTRSAGRASKPTYKKPMAMSGTRSRSGSTSSSSGFRSPVLYNPERLNYGKGYSISNNVISRPDGSWYSNPTSPKARQRISSRLERLIESVPEEVLGGGADWLSARRFSAKKKKSLRRKNKIG